MGKDGSRVGFSGGTVIEERSLPCFTVTIMCQHGPLFDRVT